MFPLQRKPRRRRPRRGSPNLRPLPTLLNFTIKKAARVSSRGTARDFSTPGISPRTSVPVECSTLCGASLTVAELAGSFRLLTRTRQRSNHFTLRVRVIAWTYTWMTRPPLNSLVICSLIPVPSPYLKRCALCINVRLPVGPSNKASVDVTHPDDHSRAEPACP